MGPGRVALTRWDASQYSVLSTQYSAAEGGGQ